MTRLTTSRTVVPALLTSLLLVPVADAQRNRKPKLTEEDLVPSELFLEKDKKRLGYATGFDALYFQDESGHHWKLTEPPVSFEPAPTPEPTPTPEPVEGATPTPTPTPSPTPPPTPEPLDETSHEIQFLQDAGLVRPTFVTMVFAESAEAAKQMVDDYVKSRKQLQPEETEAEAKKRLAAEKKKEEEEEAAKAAAAAEGGEEGAAKDAPEPVFTPADVEYRDGVAYHKNLAVFRLEKDATIGRGAYIYNREFNLGPKTGGMRRAASIVTSKGNIFLLVDARKGIKDGAFDERQTTLEKRARDVAKYLLRKM